jgi:aryl-alcohol dehydrogenase-like predicted oxidoreductase
VHRAEFERELAEVCAQYGVGVVPYSPLAGGFLTGKYRPDETPESARAGGLRRHFKEQNWRLLDLMEQVGKEHGGASISQIALAWMFANPLVTSLIIGPRSLEQLQDNLGAVELRLSPEEKRLLDEASEWREMS